jgi:hypothetical protein
MGGWKASGIGKRHGPPGIRKYCRQQTLLVTRRALRREPQMFPYRRGLTRAALGIVRLAYGRPARRRRRFRR